MVLLLSHLARHMKAADIVGYPVGLEPRDRLTFANAYASSYVQNIYAATGLSRSNNEDHDSSRQDNV